MPFDSAFADPDGGFVGSGRRRPASLRTILHLVGHVAALRTPYRVAQLALPVIGVQGPDAWSHVMMKFLVLVRELGLKPIIPGSEAAWETQPLEFFADCYALCLTEPDVLDWVSAVLREWMEKGGYREL
ncbi:hypothetical protein GCM10023205_83450 [Yinghuangia aomiensis]|uniref:Uncharacterized protein n=1 Tax=Yinghuangia aomiensis TaxID=676205 RepID=A0ABP9IHE5_9ACTN